ncbi:cadmium-transporting ATPase [Beggiatoa sp. PS]|nr:cadmium-transporting ATPase [Beggiatoa sp. PS]
MILGTLALGSILYFGFKELKNGFKKDKSSLPRKTSIKTQTAMEDRLTQLFEANTPSDDNKKIKTYEKKSKREMVSASIALALSTAGFYYYPLGPLSLPFVIYASRDVYKKAFQLIKQGKVSVSTLMTITIVGVVIMGRFFIASLIAFLIKLALRVTARMAQTSKKQLFDVFEHHMDFVWIIVDGVEVRIPFNDLQSGDVVVVHAGEIIPADGTVAEGMASVDQHILTGEARPIERGYGEEVFASTVVLSGKIHIKVEKTGEESTVAKITHILNHTVDFKSTTQLRAETFSEHLVKPALVAGCVALPMLGFSSALAVLNAHPKNKIMLLAPLSIMNHLNLASKQGILIKDGRSLELLKQVDTIVFDKTGTLTEEQPHVGAIHCCSHYNENDILIYAAAAEYKQSHPLAKAIQQEAEKRQLSVPPIDDSEYKIGYGLIVDVAGQTIHVGSDRFMEVVGMTIPLRIKQQQQLSHEEGYTLILVAVDNNVIGGIELLPTVRSEAKKVISLLKQRPNIKSTYIISGDNEVPTKKLAQELGIDHYFAETLPESKADIIEQLQQQGHFICYIGDGINDSIALKKSQVSVSLRGASTIATDTAQIVLMDQGLNHLSLLFDLADDFNTNMNTTFAILLTPAILGVSGAFLFGFGIAYTVALNMTGLAFGIGNVMIPLLKKPTKSLDLESSNEGE